jgi:hypothetical protein
MAAILRTVGGLVFTVLLLSACASGPPESATPTPPPPTATPTPLPPTATSIPRPTDTPRPGEIASKVEDVVGVWESRFQGSVAYMHFMPDGTFELTDSVGSLESRLYVFGKFWFEGTEFRVDDSGCRDPGTYEVRVLGQEDKRIQLTFTGIKDFCLERSGDLRTPLLWAEP